MVAHRDGLLNHSVGRRVSLGEERSFAQMQDELDRKGGSYMLPSPQPDPPSITNSPVKAKPQIQVYDNNGFRNRATHLGLGGGTSTVLKSQVYRNMTD